MSKMSTKNHHKSDAKTTNKKDPAVKKTTKRNRTNLSPESTPIPPPKKTPAIMSSNDRPLTIDTIRALLHEQTNSIQNCMRNEMKTLSDNIKAEFQLQITQINDKIDANQASVQSQINELKSNVDQCMTQTGNNEDDVKRTAKLNELKIIGISHTNSENLSAIFDLMAKLVKFDVSNAVNIPTLTRIYKRDWTTNVSTPTQIIIAKFVANHIRNEFYSLYLNKIAAKEPIMSENINLPSGKRIIIGESLTAYNSSIFTEAIKLKKEGALSQVFTKDGTVHVKAIKTAKAKPIRSQQQLELFVLGNPSTTNQQMAGGSSKTPNTTTTTTVNKNDTTTNE